MRNRYFIREVERGNSSKGVEIMIRVKNGEDPLEVIKKQFPNFDHSNVKPKTRYYDNDTGYTVYEVTLVPEDPTVIKELSESGAAPVGHTGN